LKGGEKVKNRIVSISLAVVLALSIGVVGCGGGGVPEVTEYSLTISSTEGGSVTTPGEGTFPYDEGEVVELVAEVDEGYQFVGWTGDVGTIADASAATTTLTMSGDYSITASFQVERTTGAFLDEVLITSEPDPSAAVQELKDDTLDIYAYGLANPALYAEVLADPNLTLVSSLGAFHEFTFNPVGPTFPATGKLNPFSDPRFREAMNWLVDRDYICDEIMGGLAVPKVCAISTAGVDGTVRFASEVAALEMEYAHNPTKAECVINSVMTNLGATKEGGKWMYNGEQVEIIGAIRTEDERKLMGDYFADLLEDLGFTVKRQYGTTSVLRPLWLYGDPNRGVFHYYTGGWASTMIPLDEGDNFGAFYTNLYSAALNMSPLWQAYEPDPVFYEAAQRLWNYDYSSMAERAGYFETCLEMSLEDSVRIWLCDRVSFSPMQADVRLAHDTYGGIYGSWMWAQTAHFVDDEGEPIVGGIMRIGTGDILTGPWNPVAGTNWVYDMFPMRATGDMDTQPDTRTGLRWAGRLEKAEVIVKQGQPIEVTNTDWCKLTFVPEVQVPLDAWADWDATTQTFLTVRDRFGPGGTTAIRKTVSYFPKDIFQTPLHDGSTLSLGDFLMFAILLFDRGKPASPMYDEGYVAEFEAWMSPFKGVKFITNDSDYGLIVEYYSDYRPLNAELCVGAGTITSSSMFPVYTQGPGMWHTIALGIMAETDKELAFSQGKSDKLGVEWMSFIDGPSLPILKSYLESAKATNYIPYEPTMGLYVTEAEAAERWSNLERWYSDKGHFWVASGPFYLESADTTEKIIHLKRFEEYPDPSDRWLFLLEPLP
jgi:peptide/nickel transport system substrate-binding protein